MEYKILMVLMSAIVVCSGQFDRTKVALAKEKMKRLPTHDVCGMSVVSSGEKIVGGGPAELDSYPWLANIGYRTKGTKNAIRWACAGSLITDQHIVTAAHCLDPKVIRVRTGFNEVEQLEVASVRLGELDLDPKVQDGANPIDFDVENIIFNKDFDNDIKVNDIGIIKLKTKVKFSDHIRPICLPTSEFNDNLFVGFSPIAAGWGRSELRTRETRLLHVEVEISSLEECKRLISSLNTKYVIDDKVICAGSSGRDSCQGDSGAPLMFHHKVKNAPAKSSGNWFMMGIVSYGEPACSGAIPGIYTRVSKQMSWIFENLDI